MKNLCVWPNMTCRDDVSAQFPDDSVMVDLRDRNLDSLHDLVPHHRRIIIDMATDPVNENSIQECVDWIRLSGLANQVCVLHNQFEMRIKNTIYLPLWMLSQSFWPGKKINADRAWNWCCVNGGTIYHRLETARFMHENFSRQECFLTCAYNGDYADQYIHNTWISREYAQRWLNVLPIQRPEIEPYDREHPQHDIDFACENSYVNIVTETSVHHGFISEKTAKPIRAAQFFVLIAAPGTIQQLRLWGFDTFDDVFEGHAYDQVPTSRERMRMAFDLVLRLKQKNWNQIWQQCRGRLEQNQQRLASDLFRQDILHALRRWSRV